MKELIKQQNAKIDLKTLDRIYYTDSENDQIALSDDEDLREAHRYKRQKGLRELKVNVLVKGNDGGTQELGVPSERTTKVQENNREKVND